MKFLSTLMLITFIIWCFDFSSCNQHSSNQTSHKIPLYITALQPLTNAWIKEYGILAYYAGLMAIRDINQRSDILRDYELRMDVGNTQVSE